VTTESCEACDRDVRIAGGVANLWTFESDRSGGMTLELEDGSEWFLCFECIEALPESATSADVTSLDSPTDRDDHQTGNNESEQHANSHGDDPSVSAAFPTGLTVGAIVGVVLGAIAGEAELGAWSGAGVGALVGLVWPTLREWLR